MKTLAIMYPECTDFEIMLAVNLLGESFPVDVATPDGLPHRSKTGIVFESDGSFGEVAVADYGCVLVPGGDPYDMLDDRSLHALLTAANKQDAVIGAICAGPLVLASAGLLRDRRFTHGFGNLHRETIDPYWDGAVFVDESLVVDGRIVTAKPEAHVEFGVELAVMMGAVAPGRKTVLTDFYNGVARKQ